MNWRVKFTYICVEESRRDVQIDYNEYYITDDLAKIKFPHVDNVLQYNGHDYMLNYIEITPTNDKILI